MEELTEIDYFTVTTGDVESSTRSCRDFIPRLHLPRTNHILGQRD